MKNINHKKGFTLIELLISITIFSGFMIVVANAYVDIVRAQKTANETRLIYSELREFVDLVQTDLREGGVDYFCYNQDFLVNPDFTATSLARCADGADLTIAADNNLRTISKDGLTSSIIKFGDLGDGTQGLSELKFRNVNGSWGREPGYESAYQPISFANLKINSLRFEIYPKVDPKAASSQKMLESQIQPMVRMYLDVGSKIPNVPFDMKYETLLTARNN